MRGSVNLYILFQLIFYGEIENSNKVIAIYQKDKKIIYTCGLKDKKPEIIVFGTAGKNVFKNVKEVELDDMIIQKGIDYFIKCVRTLVALAVRWITPTLKMLL